MLKALPNMEPNTPNSNQNLDANANLNAASESNAPANIGLNSFYLKVALFLCIIIASLVVFRYAESKKSHEANKNAVADMIADTSLESSEAIPSNEPTAALRAEARSAASNSGYTTTTVTMAGKSFAAEISDTEALRELGLSNRAAIAADAAMLFIFQQDNSNMFWMKDMHFAIDMIWLDSNKKVIYMAERVTPESYPQTFGPSAKSRYVIEVKSGIANKIGLKVGDTVSF